jgi:outer membrane protein assembly factor BamB
LSLVCTAVVAFAGCAGSAGSAGQQSTATPVVGVTPGLTAVATSTASQKWDNWYMYHHDTARSGYLANMPDPTKLSLAWNANLDGAVYGQPLIVNGHLIAATEGDTIYSLDPQTGKILWQTNLGTPVQQSTLPCGDIDPLGITGTPAYDPATNQVFAVAEITGPQHILVALDAMTGHVNFRRDIDLPSMDRAPYQERAGLVVNNGLVYVTYGGLAGDCGNYRGTVIGSKTNGQGNLLSYVVPTPREGGMWAPPGPSIDSQGNLFVSVGNGAETSGSWDHSDSVLRLSPQLKLEDAFAPSNWQAENSSDTDLGSTGPMLLPNGFVFIAGKSGKGYVLRANALGGIGGQVSEAQICNGTAMGGGALIGSYLIVPCTDGIRRITIDSTGKITVGWHSTDVGLAPTAGGHTVYGLNQAGTLYALDLATGNVRAQVNIGITVPHFASPTLSGHSVFVGTMQGVAAVNLS